MPPVFTWLQQLGDVDDDEMYRVFNMGIGLALVVSPYYAESIQQQLAKSGLASWPIGRAVEGTSESTGHSVGGIVDSIQGIIRESVGHGGFVEGGQQMTQWFTWYAATQYAVPPTGCGVLSTAYRCVHCLLSIHAPGPMTAVGVFYRTSTPGGRIMAHRVLMTLPPREIKRADAVFSVEQDGKKFGTLEVSNGSLVWFPARTTYGDKVSWQKFHDLMEEFATRIEKR